MVGFDGGVGATMDIVVRSMPGHALLGEHHGLGTAKLF